VSNRYSMLIQWSAEDEAYVVTFREFPGAHTHGASYEEAVKNGEDVLEILVKVLKRRVENATRYPLVGLPKDHRAG
jgi:predicted RNase H-like HicB family nuclease